MRTYVDIHCHPSMKPFGLAYPCNKNNPDASIRNSIWYNDPPTIADNIWGWSLGITRFSQSNFTAMSQGKCSIVVVALNPVEKGFFTTRCGKTGKLVDWLGNFASGIGRLKIDFIQQNKDDFNQLNCEYNFYQQLNNYPLTIYGKKVYYRLTSNYSDIVINHNNPDNVISVVLSIEGANLFSNDNSEAPDKTLLLANIDKVKKWQHPPLFVTFSHHFNNYLGGHARSLPGIIKYILDEKKCVDDEIKPLGKKVIKSLLNKKKGRRIYIDIKHMSRKLRLSYYRILEKRYKSDQIPIIVSHGAVNGYPVLNDSDSSPAERNGLFNGRDINFYDDEIIKIAKSKGIFGLQIDKRQITNKCEYRKIKYLCYKKEKRDKRWTRLVWNQIQYIADLLDANELPAWNITCLGTDFDGIINPIKEYSTSAHIPSLYSNLREFAKEYLNHKKFSVSLNNLTPKEIMDKIFFENAMIFLSKHYKP